MVDEQEVVRDFLGDRAGSEQLRQWRETLEHRLHSLEAEAKRLEGAERAAVEGRLPPLRKQIAALHKEEAVTGFVEESVRATLAMGASGGTDEEY